MIFFHQSLKNKLSSIYIFLFASILLISCASTSADFYSEEMKNLSSLSEKLESAENNINGDFPDKIVIKTLSQTFTKDFYFTLHDGKIYYKGKNDKSWHLFTSTGLPHPNKITLGGFPIPKKIVEISADGDVFAAFDDEGKMYECFLRKTAFEKPFVWKSKFGFPNNSTLEQNVQVSDKRGWALAARRTDVLWYTDSFGNDHHYGTMGLETVYFLLENGQEIVFTDSGLPPDWSKSILGPERGSFIAENISVSASTIFLINKAGEMYTRLIDFDTMGSDPMFFKYTYKPYTQKYSGKNYLSNYTPWGLPNEDWKKQPNIVLHGSAKISKYITILQTGHGNYARELRVAGTDSNGNTGFYFKDLAARNWSFEPCELNIPASDYFENSTEDASSLRGEKLEYSYSGFITKNGIKDNSLSVSINNLPLTSEGNCIITISDGSNSVDILLYLVEIWTYTKRFSPGTDGTPRYYFVTPHFLESAIDKDGDFYEKVKDLFSGKDLEIFSFTAEATDLYFEMGIDNKKSANQYKIFLTKDGNCNIHPTLYKLSLLYNQNIIDSYNSDVLKLPKDKIYTHKDVFFVREIIENNEYYKKILQGELDSYNMLKHSTSRTRWGYKFADLVASITLLDQINFPKIKTLTSYGDTILQKNAEKYKAQADYRKQVYPPVISLTQARIDEYKSVLAKIEREDGSAIVSGSLKDFYNEYFESIGLPKYLKGKIVYTEQEINTILRISDDTPLFPGFFFHSKADDYSDLIEIVVTDTPDKIASMQKNDIKLKVQYFIFDENDLNAKVLGLSRFSKLKGTLTYDGENLKLYIEEMNEESKRIETKLLFTGKAGIDDLTDNE